MVNTYVVDWTKIPVHNIDVSKLNHPADIVDIFKQSKIDKYLYQITYKGIVLKYGMSADNSGMWGERLYRQIGHSSFWDKGTRFTGSSGSDYRIIEEDFKKKYGLEIQKDGLTIRVWNASNYPFDSLDPWMEVNRMERELIESYVKVVGEKPIGNINDEPDYRKRARITKEIFDPLFEYSDSPVVKRIYKK